MNLWSFRGTVIRSSRASLFKGRVTLLGQVVGDQPAISRQLPIGDCSSSVTLATQHVANTAVCYLLCGQYHRKMKDWIGCTGYPIPSWWPVVLGGHGRAHWAGEPAEDSSACKTHQKADVIGQILLLDRNIIKLVQEWVTTHNRWDCWCHG